MVAVPISASKRLVAAVPKFKDILMRAKERDINESDTVTIVTDILSEVFGFDKYSEITREHVVQGTYCDIAIQTEKGVEYLIEVKAIGLTLNSRHLRQAVNYAAREGINWVVLTNGIDWELHRVSVEDKVQNELMFRFSFAEINMRQKESVELLFLLCKRGVQKDLISDYYQRKQSINRYTVGALMLTEPVINVVRRELRKYKPEIKVDSSEIEELVEKEVIKREILDSEAGLEARKQVAKYVKRLESGKNKPEASSRANAGRQDRDELAKPSAAAGPASDSPNGEEFK